MMGTSANIGVLGDNNVVRAITVSYDGNPEHTGRMLLEHYATEEKARELVCLGDCRSVQPTLDECEPYAKREGEDPEDCAPEDMDLGFYSAQFDADFAYLFRDGRWQWRKSHDGRWVDLSRKKLGLPATAAKPVDFAAAVERARKEKKVPFTIECVLDDGSTLRVKIAAQVEDKAASLKVFADLLQEQHTAMVAQKQPKGGA